MGGKIETILKIETKKSNMLFIHFFIAVNAVLLILSLLLGYSGSIVLFNINKSLLQVYQAQIQFHLIVLLFLLIPIRVLMAKVDKPTFYKYLLAFLYLFYIISVLIINIRNVTELDQRFDAFNLILLLSLNVFGLIYISRTLFIASTIIAAAATIIFSNDWVLFGQEPNFMFIILNRTALVLIISLGMYVGLNRMFKLLNGVLDDNVNPYIDPLTGVYNKHYLKEKIAGTTVGEGRKLSIITAGIDNMKEVNSTYGFSAGDAILQGVTNIIQRMTRQTDSVCRTEGDTMAIIVNHPEVFQVEELAERIRYTIENEKFNIIDKNNAQAEVNITASFGVVTLGEGENSDTLLSKGEEALAKAKKMGKNRIEKSS